MNFQKFLILITAFILLTFAGCGSGTTTDNAVNTNAVNTNAAVNSNSSDPAKKPETATVNSAPTVAPVVQAYYDALKKKDDTAMKKVLTADFIKSLEVEMKEEKKTSLTAFIAGSEIIPDKPVEVRNEKIDGNTAIAELKGGTYVNWTPMKFIKENGEWKRTNESPDIDEVKKSANSSTNAPAGNAAK